MQKGVSEPKIISLYPLMVSMITSSSSSFVFMQFRRAMFNFFASSNRRLVHLLIYSFCGPRRLTKIFLGLLLDLKKFIIIIIIIIIILLLNMLHFLFFYIAVNTLFNIHLGMIIFTLFIDRVNFQHCCCFTIYIIWRHLNMKICFYVFFPCFQLTTDVTAFYRFRRQFFK